MDHPVLIVVAVVIAAVIFLIVQSARKAKTNAPSATGSNPTRGGGGRNHTEQQ